jgi:hypothetical protein
MDLHRFDPLATSLRRGCPAAPRWAARMSRRTAPPRRGWTSRPATGRIAGRTRAG